MSGLGHSFSKTNIGTGTPTAYSKYTSGGCENPGYESYIAGMQSQTKDQFRDCESPLHCMQFQVPDTESHSVTGVTPYRKSSKQSQGDLTEGEGYPMLMTDEECEHHYRLIVVCQCQLCKIPGTPQLKKGQEKQCLHPVKKKQASVMVDVPAQLISWPKD